MHYQEIVTRIEEWYKRYGRSFTWRNNRSPFEILLAEILLWKTRAESVDKVFARFIEKYGTPKKLASARLDDLVQELKPLGLHNRRARLLIKIGEALLNSDIPRTQYELEQLLGVGQYISRAVLCFAFNVPVIPVDTNVRRVIERVFGFRFHNLRKLNKEEEELLSQLSRFCEDCKKLSWGLVDIAALICKPKNPLCYECPLRDFCRWWKEGRHNHLDAGVPSTVNELDRTETTCRIFKSHREG